MAGAFVQSNKSENAAIWATDGAESVSLPVDATAGNWIVVLARMVRNDRTPSSCTDNGGTSYSLIGSAKQNSTPGQLVMYAGRATAAGAGTNVTLTWSGGDNSNNGEMMVMEFSGLATSQTALTSAAPQASHNRNTGSTTTHDSGVVSPTPTSNNVTIGFMCRTTGAAVWTEDSGFTELAFTGSQANELFAGYVLNSANATEELNATSDINRASGLMILMLEGSGASTATLQPAQATLTLNGRAPTMNPFSSVTIRETLINEAGSLVANATGITVLVWRASSASGAPDQTLSNQTTDASGLTAWAINTGSLAYNDPIFYVAFRGSPPDTFTAGRIIPSYA